jgi:hypothetical protein
MAAVYRRKLVMTHKSKIDLLNSDKISKHDFDPSGFLMILNMACNFLSSYP